MSLGTQNLKTTSSFALFCLTMLVAPQSANAYIGPGLSVGGMVVLLIVLFSILLAFYAIVWFPIKRRLKAKKEAQNPLDPHEPSEPSE